ncbi:MULTISPECIES: phospholipase D family protein [unclassified Lysobacter]|uniref:phospholipase D family protein n=1 Tax=unclassified Lysobacter TaxID=2635362 RepID=UPI001BE79F37|nr:MULTISPECIES: phospholipase D family protein [unclassified Lysobacter]MBT2747205.1 phospholipase D family protein [Lysobacter sp. ISL-42]MBT2750291.1 phospholipase D family protein [Lysobacter sp. ISL-50]MBT2777743.1 phospholipase D family protein [Lysobacter sp. ISL-54]MBT2783679.1 phospholipase D family protein [Lysobacter sp. ISL-52]
MNPVLRGLAALLALSLSACASLSPAQRDRASAIAAAARSQQIDCQGENACAQPSPLYELGRKAMAQSTPERPRHYALILDRGPDALLARINLIRSATHSLDLQTYIFDEDDAGKLVLDEVLAAARRGVSVRLLLDQLAAMRHIDTLAALAGAHANFEVKLYNPVLHRARINYPQYVLAAACCWRRLNQRMHTKLLLADNRVGISGGRNYQDDYYDWDDQYNFRDRDVLVAGPVADIMGTDFEVFWSDRRSVPVERLADVGKRLIDGGVPVLPKTEFERPQRAQAMRDAAADEAQINERLVSHAIEVGAVRYISDTPNKHRENSDANALASDSLRSLITHSKEEVILQTPYLVLSKSAQQLFRSLHDRPDRPRVIVSTNSLAATDAFIAYALSYKYKRRYLREFGFNIYEYKPFPADAPIDIAATGATLPDLGLDGLGERDGRAEPESVQGAGLAESRRQRRELDRSSVLYRQRYRQPLAREYAAMRYARRRTNEPVPLKRAGVRIGMHAKSMVIDERIGVIGTHNFDPRGDHYNTESAVVIDDPVFAQALAASIRRDIAPANSWVIARRDKPPIFSGLEYSIAKISEHLPIFDLWPVRYATSYEFVPGPACPSPLYRTDPGFRACYKPVGDFPEVNLGVKSLTTRMFTAFGAGLAPIL